MRTPEVQIRAATPDDSSSIAALLSQLGYPADATEIPARLSGMLKHGGTVVLAVDGDDSPLGLLAMTRHWGLHSSGPIAYIMALVIAETARRRGVGKTLVDYAKQWGIDNGCERINVTSAEHRDGAHEFYPAMGLPYTGPTFLGHTREQQLLNSRLRIN